VAPGRRACERGAGRGVRGGAFKRERDERDEYAERDEHCAHGEYSAHGEHCDEDDCDAYDQ
jgi:hypothetical protein